MSDPTAEKASRKKKVAANKSGYLAFNDELMVDDMDQDLFAACNEPAPVPAPRTGRMSSMMNRRRSSMGLSGSRRASISETEQVRIVEMYKTVIQMSSENKLTEKNSWNYDLIDHMGRLIKDESTGVNFQKASCTLDASVKIYSNRVDDTYATSHRILESLSRGGKHEDGGDDTDAFGEKAKAKVGTKASSSRLNATDTIERNPSALNAVKLENDYAFDPTFHKLSKAFDEGGAKGMLLYNMRLSKRDCSLAFVRGAAPKTAHAAKAPSVNMRDLVARSGLSVDSVSRLHICPKLEEFRHVLNPASSSQSSTTAVRCNNVLTTTSLANLHRFESFEAPETSADTEEATGHQAAAGEPAFSSIATPGRPLQSRVPFASQTENATNDASSPVAYHDDGDVGDFWSPVYNVDEPVVRSPISGPSSTLDIPNMKLRWSLDGSSEQGKENHRALQQSLEVLNAGNDYAYFDLDAITTGGSNAWAGSQHWRYATRSRSQPAEQAAASNSAAEAEGEANKKKETKKKAAKKDVQSLVLSLDLIDEAKFCSSKGRTDTTVMTKAAQAKADDESSSLLLPVDEKFQVKDLCRLSLWPNVVVAPKNVNPLTLSAASTQTGKSLKNRAQILVDFMTGGETFWSQNGVTLGAPSNDNMVPINIRFDGGAANDDGGYDFDDAGGDYNGDDMPDQLPAEPQTDAAPNPPLSGLNINMNNLVQADRTVEKINIKYEKVSKRVNVHKLKTDILHHIHDNLDASQASSESARLSQGSTRDSHGGQLHQEMSFQDMVKTLSVDMQQKDVTVPYYFICLLHLANEQTLKISDREDLTDLSIKFD